MAETTSKGVTPKQATCSANPGATDQRIQRLITDVAAGRRTVDRAWHQFRDIGASLDQWIAFATVCRGRGRHYDNRWAKHQYNCWTLQLESGTYPQQRAKWAAEQAAFAERMRLKSGAGGRVLTNAQRRAATCTAKPEPDHAQLALFS